MPRWTFKRSDPYNRNRGKAAPELSAGNPPPVLVPPQPDPVPVQDIAAGDGGALRVRAYTSVVTTLVVSGVADDRRGNAAPFEYRIDLTIDDVSEQTTWFPVVGRVRNVVIYTTAEVFHSGRTFVLVDWVAGMQTNVVLRPLIAGYAMYNQPLHFPGGEMCGPLDGPGYVHWVTGTDPAAGSEFMETVPTGRMWNVLGVTAVLVCDATVANRNIQFRLRDPSGRTVTGMYNNFSQTAGATYTHNWFPYGAAQPLLGGISSGSFPLEMWLPDGSQVFSFTANLQAGDNWGPPMMLVRQFLLPGTV